MEESKKPKTTQEDSQKNSQSNFAWWQDEVYLNNRMNIIGQNGNDGVHYFWEDSWNQKPKYHEQRSLADGLPPNTESLRDDTAT